MKKLKIAGAVAVCAALVCSAVAFAGCSSSSSSTTKTYSDSEKVTVRVGYWGGTCEAPLAVAYEQGFFEKYGITAQMEKITSGAAAFMTEEGYAIHEATPNFLPAIQQGLDEKYISSVHTGCIQACATADSGITSVKDLEGKTVGTFDTHDMGEIFLRAAMVNAGADPDKVTFVTEGNIGTMLTAAAAGEVVAFCNFDPYVEVACQYMGYTKIFSNSTDENFKDSICCFLAANNAVYSDSDIAYRCAKAVDDACKWITENPEETVSILEGENSSGTQYVVPSTQLLTAFGVDSSKASGSNLHVDLVKSYTWGDTGKDNFTNSIKKQWETIKTAGMLSGSQTIDELTSLVGSYAL